MNATIMLHPNESDSPTASLNAGAASYVTLRLDSAYATVFVDQPAYLDTLIRELQTVQAAWAINRGEPVSS